MYELFFCGFTGHPLRLAGLTAGLLGLPAQLLFGQTVLLFQTALRPALLTRDDAFAALLFARLAPLFALGENRRETEAEGGLWNSVESYVGKRSA